MNTYEELLYLIRIPVLLVSAVVIALIFQFAQPELAQAESHAGDELKGIEPVRADLYAAIVASSDLLHARPGVFSQEAFTQATADQILDGPEMQPHLYAVQAQLLTPQGEEITERITVNQPAWTVLEPRVGRSGVDQLHKRLPAAAQDRDGQRQQAILEVTVTYES